MIWEIDKEGLEMRLKLMRTDYMTDFDNCLTHEHNKKIKALEGIKVIHNVLNLLDIYCSEVGRE